MNTFHANAFGSFEGLSRLQNTTAPATIDPSFHWRVLHRCDRRPLVVVARSLLQAHNRCAALPCWSELEIYETASGRFAASLRHILAGVPGTAARPIWAHAWLCTTADEVRAVFHAHDPLWVLPPLAGSNGQTRPDAPEMTSKLRWCGDTATAQRFHAAWAGLLAAVFGLSRRSRGNA